jgi:hypothetical protein
LAYRVRPTHVHLGIDSRGAAHCWRLPTNSVHIIRPDGTREQRISITDTAFVDDIDHYVVVLGGRRGWDELRYGFQAFAERLVEAV